MNPLSSPSLAGNELASVNQAAASFWVPTSRPRVRSVNTASGKGYAQPEPHEPLAGSWTQQIEIEETTKFTGD